MAQQQPAEADLAYGWAEMRDQYGVYYINLYTKQTSRIKPGRASVFQQRLPPPPDESGSDTAHKQPQQVQAQAQQMQNAPISPLSPQQQMYNQQLYQQQWRAYYAQQYQQQQQHQQYQYQQYMMAQQQQQQQQQQLQQQFPPPPPEQQQQEQEDDDEEEESSASTVSSSGQETDEDEEESEQNLQSNPAQPPQPQPQPQQQQQQQQAQSVAQSQAAALRAVPPINNNEEPQQFLFQPIMPMPAQQMVAVDNKNADTEAVSAAFSANKLAEVAVNVDFTGPLPADEEGTDMDASNQNQANAKAAAPDPVINKQQSTIFGVMLKTPDKNAHLAREENWDMLIEGIEQNCPLQDRYSVFKAMRKVAQNLLIDDEKYRVLYADNDMVQKKILGRVGGYELLRGLGFKQGAEENELVCKQVQHQIVKVAIDALSKRIAYLKQTKAEWDPNYGKNKKRKQSKAKQNENKKENVALDEEERMLQEALRLSQEQHVKDMLARQERELQFAKKQHAQQSIRRMQTHEEDDHKSNIL